MARWPSPGGGDWSPGLLDRAETFNESNLTLSTTGIEVNNGGLEIGRFTANEQHTVTNYTEGGIKLYPYWNIDDWTFTTHDVNPSLGYRLTDENGNTLETFSGVAGGETVSPTTSLNAEVPYRLESTSFADIGEDGDTPGSQCPGLEIVCGSYDGGDIGNTRAISSVTVEAADPRATLEWSMPPDVAGWDILPWEVSENGGSIDLYLIDPSDGTRLKGPLNTDPADISDPSTFPASTNVAVEVDMSRPSTAENPRVENVYRRRKIT